MKITDYSFTKSDVLGKIPFINQIGLDNLCDSGRLKRKKVLGVWKYDRYSVNNFLNSFNVDDYVTVSQTKDMLETNGIKDIFKRFSNKNEDGIRCKYQRVTNQFPMSVKNLIKFGYLDVDSDISPQLIKKDSVIKTIKHFGGKRVSQQPKKLYTPTSKPTKQKSKKKVSQPKLNTPTPSNNRDFYQRLLEKIEEKSS
jgi:hypothetical protein